MPSVPSSRESTSSDVPIATRLWAVVGAVNALLSVTAGAFGAHSLRGRVPSELLAVFETGARYHMYHALGMFAVAWLASWRARAAHAVGGLLLAGTVLFSGSLYVLALTGVRTFGAVTPVGGVAFIVGWALFAWVAWGGGRSARL